jgi:hypothetical protein
MNVVVPVLNIFFLAFISYRVWQRERSSIKRFFWPSLFLKLVAGVCIGLVYTYYYKTGDTFNYFNDGVILAKLAKADFAAYIDFLWLSDEPFPIWSESELIYRQPRAMFLSKFTSLFCLLTTNSYWVISFYFSMISFLCAWLLVKKIADLYPHAKVAVIISFLFFPTVVFWTSGIIKESIAMASLFFLVVVFLKIWNKEKVSIREWMLTLIFLWLLWNLKYYYLAIFLPVAITTLVLQRILSKVNIKKTTFRIALWLFIFTVPLSVISILHPNFYPERFLEVIVSSYYEYEAISSPEDLIRYNSLKPTFFSVLQNMPAALFSGLFRPFIVEADTALQFLVSFENLLLVVLFTSALTNMRKLIGSKHRILLFSIIVYTVLLCTFLALSAPNFGTLSRYRVGFLPFFLLLLTIENPLINKIMTLKPLRNLVR